MVDWLAAASDTLHLAAPIHRSSSLLSANDWLHEEHMISVLTFSRSTVPFHTAIRECSVSLRLQQEGHFVLKRMDCGRAAVLVRGIDCRRLKHEMRIRNVHSRAWSSTVVVSCRNEEIVMKTIHALPYNQRPRLKKHGRFTVPLLDICSDGIALCFGEQLHW